ncbi:multifunctional transcriptional regulator/nicotinamide-nucleotide adenylyltransferase/ribosylnicotinamide kinase NadR [Thermoflavimicrobium dichotomicum]|uniref:HTH-type transcriptional regulator, transcriptional repressor of NAD biosynthesis genes n=1 Tax=Thermoflavimicrobium dichotomicum TaxID=46223 RepID=A0A1I3SAM8_9BACL|nr:multifunctional transcriptional regulator/nicotinamide-nucleotide adenylyltransferase/ribosylnicotinamide kinase NadR [Thermoflavimicrobium dichotomicum]SFJ55450.1 HTH-type transcriptional regulator, transcriptional repressor of NAD biosynthesis genes [Thermoflavimicrobium dichotomicum]
MKKVGFFGGKFLPLHMGHVYVITKAACMVEELYVILSYSKSRDSLLCQAGRIPDLPHSVRLQWLTTVTRDMENVKVLAVEDDAPSDETYDWEKGAYEIKKAIGKPIDVVFSSEHSYDPIFKRLYPDAEHVVIDSDRSHYPVSGTAIRKHGPYRYWDYIPNAVKSYFVKKVAIVGTESCGKSTLTRYLAQIYGTTYVEEYGRTICEEIGGCDGIINEEHFKEIVFGHKYMEYQKVKEANKVLFIDSEAVVSQYYAELYLGYPCSWIEGAILAQNYDLYLYLEPDVPWIDDGFRVHGDEKIRQCNNEKLKQMFQERNIPIVTIRGSYLERLEQAKRAVDQLLFG